MAILKLSVALLLGVSGSRKGEVPDAAAAERAGLTAVRTAAARAMLGAPQDPAADAPLSGQGRPDEMWFSGQILSSETSAGVRGAMLTVIRLGVAFTVTADRRGVFRFEPPAAGAYEVAAIAAPGYFSVVPDGARSRVSLVARPSEGVRDIVFFLAPDREYRGRVVDAGGRPVQGARVSIRETDLPEASRALVSNEAGEFRFHAPEGAVVEARHPDFGPARALVDAEVRLSRSVVLVLGAPSPTVGSISGVAVDPAGRGVVGALIVARAEQSPAEARPSVRVTAGAGGRFAMEGIEAGVYTLTASAPNLAPAAVEHVATGSDRVVLALVNAGFLRGAVLSPEGRQPASGFTLRIVPRQAPSLPPVVTTFFDGNGRFSIGGVAPGSYLVTTTGRGGTPARFVVSTVADDDPAGGPNLTLAHGGRVRGRVIDAESGVGLSAARVSIEGSLDDIASPQPLLATTATGDDGWFDLTGIAPGQRSLIVTADRHRGRILPAQHVGLFASDPIVVPLDAAAEGDAPLESAGIGATLAEKADKLVLLSVESGGGAAEAGLVAGDAIAAVEGQSVSQAGAVAAMQLLRGVEGTPVRIAVRRGAGGTPIELVVFRRRVNATGQFAP